MSITPSFFIEAECNVSPVCGIDEAGRGPWAGPVVASAVIFKTHELPAGLNDSKKLTAAAREALYATIMANCHVGVGEASVEEIDRLNIWRATELAMQRAMAALPVAPLYALIDGNRLPALEIPATAIVKGDSKSASIAAASVIAKVTRDRIMNAYAAQYPEYGFDTNAGYGTAKHQQAIAEYGILPIHRQSFAPIRAALEKRAV
ncbi:MAG: ribonuclease HII [Rickettsiales bacterium]